MKKCIVIVSVLVTVAQCWGTTFVWNGSGTTANWSDGANWTGGVAPTNNGSAAIVLAGTTQLSPNVDTNWDISSLIFSNSAGAFVLGGGTLNIRAGGVTNNSANGQSINDAITLGTNQTWNAVAGVLVFNGNINNVTNLLTIAGISNSFIAGVISGTGGFTKTGTGTNYLSGANTYSGLTTISAGMVSIQNSSALGSATASTTVANGATLQLQGGIKVTNQGLTLSGSGVSALGALRSVTNNNAWNGPITLAAAATIGCDTNSLTLGAGGIFSSNFLATFTGGGNINANGSVGNGTGGLTKGGVGTLTLTASNSYGGITAVSAGILNIQNGSALSGTGTTVASGAQLQLQGGVTVTGEILSLSGTGIANSGAFRNINGSNSWSGTITLTASSTIGSDAGTLDLEANLINSIYTTTFTNVGTIIFNGALGGGTGGLVKIGTGTLQLGGANTYTGITTISGGTAQLTASGSVSSAVTVNTGAAFDLNSFNESILSLAGTGSVTLGNGKLTVNNTAATTFSGVMSGAGGLTEAGTNTLTLSGVNTYTGGTTINAGTISIKADNNLGAATGALTLNGGQLLISVTLASGRPVTLGANNGLFNTSSKILTLSNTISGPGALTKIGTGGLTLTGTNTYLGGTTNAAGTITINSEAALGNSGGALVFSNSATLTTTATFTSARNIFLNAGTATFSCGTGFTNTFNGVISGAGALTQSGAGGMILGGNNIFTNLLTISKGTVRLGGNERISDLAPVLISSTTATFDLNGFNETIGSLASSSAGKVTLGTGFLTAGGNNLSTTNFAVISGGGGFTKTGGGNLIFTGSNTYTNTTTIAAGSLELGASERIANGSPLVISNGATFNLTWNATNYNETVGSLAGAGNVILGTGTLTAGSAGGANFPGSINGAGAFTKVGTGTQIFSGTNSYSGATTVSVGNFQVNGNSAASAVTIASGATLSGSGAVGAVAVNSGATNSPGTAAPGTLATGTETWAGGGHYSFEINDAAGTKGVNWDWLNISGALNINATSGSQFNLEIVSLTPANAAGIVTNFNNTLTYVWTVASASGGINGFNAASFNLVTSAFQNSLGAGTFSLSQSGNDLNLIFTSAAAAAIKGVQSGTLISSGNGTNTATLGTAVVPTNAFLIFNTRHNSSLPGGSMIRGSITSSNTVTFVRATTETSSMNIQWSVVEYSAGVRVQRGEVNQTNTTINVALSPISAVNQAFVTWSKTPDPGETAFSDSDPVVGEITSTNNLQFRVTSAPSAVPVISWQVIEFQNPASINVQKGSVTSLTGTNLAANSTLPAPVGTNNAFLLTGYRTSGSGTAIGARMLRAQLNSATNLYFDRSISGAPNDISEIAWQVVQLNDGSIEQDGPVNFANGIAETNATLISLNTNRAVAFSSVQSVGGQGTGRSPSTGNVPGVGSVTMSLTSATQLTLDRNNTSDQADINWQVVGFGPGSLLTPAQGGSAISADTTTNAYTSLVGPVYAEIQNGNVTLGTIILKTPAGFVFDTNTVQPNVLITRVAGSGANSLNINGVASGSTNALTTINPTNLIFTITSASSNGVTCSLTWQNLRVRPTAGTPLAVGNLVSLGTSIIQGVKTNSTSWGFLAEVVGAPVKLAIATQPSSAVIAGADFPQQPVIQVQDQFGNLRSADNTTVITASSSGTDTNDVNGTVTAVGGIASFSGLDYLIAQTNAITFSAASLASKVSSNIVVNAAAASQVTDVTQPSATAAAGINFAQQPVVQVQDAYGNLVKTDNSTVTAVIDQGSGNLFGTLAIKAVNGIATFTNLSYQIAETITIDFTDGSLDIDTSAGTTVGAAAASQLVMQAQPSAIATAGVTFAQQPSVLVEDAFGNLCVTNNITVVTASRNAATGSGTLQGGVNVTASGGVATFINLSHNVATTIAIDFNSGTLTNTTSGGILINPAGVAKLAFATQPGSATVGSIFGTQPAIITQDAFGNSSASGLANSLNVTLALTSGTGPLLGTTNFNIGTGAGNGSVTFNNLEIDSAGSKQLTVNAGGLTNAVSANFNVAKGSQTITFGSLPNKTYGTAPFVVNATASSGLPVTFIIAAGPASVSSNNVSITGAGVVTVRASQLDTTNYNATAPVDQSLTVTQAVLMVTADNQSRTYGVTNQLFTATISGFVNGDTLGSAVTGSPALNTVATTNSGTGTYSIVATNGTLAAANYNFTFINGTLAVTQSGTSIAISSSKTPSGFKDSVTFMANLANATGSLIFLTNGGAFSTNSFVSGSATSVATTLLPRGTNIITVQYVGDGNYIGSTNMLNQVVTNHPPVAAVVNVTRTAGLRLLIPWSNFATNWSDADGDPVTFLGINLVSTNGVNLMTNSTFILYTNSPNVNDKITYTISDGQGGSATGLINVVVNPFVTGQNVALNVSGSTVTLSFYGIPGYSYEVQRSTNLVTWATIWTTNTPANGAFTCTDNFSDLGFVPSSAGYRLKWQP